jgi:hypothetical protein
VARRTHSRGAGRACWIDRRCGRSGAAARALNIQRWGRTVSKYGAFRAGIEVDGVWNAHVTVTAWENRVRGGQWDELAQRLEARVCI